MCVRRLWWSLACFNFFSSSYGYRRYLHSFPTTTLFRSDLVAHAGVADVVDVVSGALGVRPVRSEEHTSELQSLTNLVCRLLLAKKKRSVSSTASPSRRSSATAP